MKSKLTRFSREYQTALAKYLRGAAGGNLPRRLGRQAVAAGLEMLDLARIHEDALRSQSRADFSASKLMALVSKASLFFAQVITPIEETHRGALESAIQLDRLNRSLLKRTSELAASNECLRKEIEHRVKIERSLRKSERHYSRLLVESARLQERLRHLSRQILSAQEEERKKISRELHDQIAATLTGVNIQLADLKKEAVGNDEVLKRKIATTQKLVQDSVDIIHRFARDLRPSTLDDLGLIPALHSFAKTFSKQTGIRISLAVSAQVEKVDITKRTVLYRVAQEALTNVAKHARATEVKVKICSSNGSVIMCVVDNGKSFQIEPFSYRKGNKRLGLLGMRERVEMVGGTFLVESEPGKGTSVQANIPIPNTRGNGASTQR